MKILKNKKMYRMLCVSTFICVVSIPVEGMQEVGREQSRAFEINQPLSEWPKISLFSREEKRCYNSTWDRNKRLSENQRELMERFISNCCDFSFKTTEKKLSGIYSGKFDTGESIVFVNSGTRICVNYDSNKVTFFSARDEGRGLEVHPRTNLLPNIKPVDFEEWMKCEFERYIQRFIEDPIGCEVLRMSIAKYEAGERDLPKIKFIPVDNQKMDLAYTVGSYVWKYVRKNGRPNFNIGADYHHRESKFIVFSTDWFNLDQKALILKLRDTNSDNFDTNDFKVVTGIMPREVGLMYQIIYAIHAEKSGEYEGTQIIEKRDDQNYFSGDFEGVGPFSILKKSLNVSIFKNDKIYRVMYGLTRQGIDLINESAYLAHKYNFIRPAYTGSNTSVNINGKILNRKESFKFLKKFLRTNGDFDLYRYYLSPKSSIKYPEFGIGQYRCSDMDFERKNSKKKK